MRRSRRNESDAERTNKVNTVVNTGCTNDAQSKDVQEPIVYLSTNIYGKEQLCRLDYGSTLSVIPYDVVRKELQMPVNDGIKDVNCVSVLALDEIEITVELGELKLPTRFLISHEVSQIKLGNNFLKDNAFVWNFKERKISKNGHEFRLVGREDTSKHYRIPNFNDERNTFRKKYQNDDISVQRMCIAEKYFLGKRGKQTRYYSRRFQGELGVEVNPVICETKFLSDEHLSEGSNSVDDIIHNVYKSFKEQSADDAQRPTALRGIWSSPVSGVTGGGT